MKLLFIKSSVTIILLAIKVFLRFTSNDLVRSFNSLIFSNGILLKQLDSKNPDRKAKHHQFLSNIGREALKSHLTSIITIGRISNNKRDFESNFNKAFQLEKDLFSDIE